MPAYSFQQRFVPLVKEGSKRHTIRARRKHVPKPGSTLQLFSAMRTKYCTRIMDAPFKKIRTIIITESEIYIVWMRLSDSQVCEVYDELTQGKSISWLANPLGGKQREDLAWKDGFRQQGSTARKTAGSFDLMLRWWKTTHELPFIGDIIYW